MIEEFKHIQSSKKDLKNFALLMGGILSILGVYLFYKYHGHYFFLTLFGLLLIFTGLIRPNILKPSQKIWMGFAIILGFLVTNIILIVFFYLCITPLSLVARIFGKKFSDLSYKENTGSSASYWKMRQDAEYSKDQLEKQF